MSVQRLANRKEYLAASGTSFAIVDFDFIENSQITVYVGGTQYTYQSGAFTGSGTEFQLWYSANTIQISGITDTNLADYIRIENDPSGSDVLIIRETILKQDHVYQEGDKYYATNNENIADKAMNLLQEHDDRLDRVPHFERKTDTSGLVLVLPPPEASKAWAWNATADEIEYVDPTGPAGPAGPAGADGINGAAASWRLLGEITAPENNIDGTIGFDPDVTVSNAIVTITNAVAGNYVFTVDSSAGLANATFTATSPGTGTQRLTAALSVTQTNVTWIRINLTATPVGTTEDIHVLLS